MSKLPKARTAEIVVQNLNGEVLVYDTKNQPGVLPERDGGDEAFFLISFVRTAAERAQIFKGFVYSRLNRIENKKRSCADSLIAATPLVFVSF